MTHDKHLSPRLEAFPTNDRGSEHLQQRVKYSYFVVNISLRGNVKLFRRRNFITPRLVGRCHTSSHLRRNRWPNSSSESKRHLRHTYTRGKNNLLKRAKRNGAWWTPFTHRLWWRWWSDALKVHELPTVYGSAPLPVEPGQIFCSCWTVRTSSTLHEAEEAAFFSFIDKQVNGRGVPLHGAPRCADVSCQMEENQQSFIHNRKTSKTSNGAIIVGD